MQLYFSLFDEFYEEMKQSFIGIVDEVKKIINDQDYEIDYPLLNGMMYCNFKVNNLLSGDDEDRIKELMNDNYHIEIELFNNCSEINIHKKI